MIDTAAPRRDFGRARRVLTAAGFAAVFSGRRQLRGAHFTLHFLPAPQPGGARLGLVIPKKQAKTAVLRNAIKRQAREVFRLRRTILPSYDLVLRLTRPLERAKAGDDAARAHWRGEIAGLLDGLPNPAPAAS